LLLDQLRWGIYTYTYTVGNKEREREKTFREVGEISFEKKPRNLFTK
jgi:hypothetical protein